MRTETLSRRKVKSAVGRVAVLAVAVFCQLAIASPAAAAAPRYIMVSGPSYHRPVLLDDWRENHQLLLEIASSPLASSSLASGLTSRPSARLALFWGWGSERPAHPADAFSKGTFYPRYRGLPAIVQVMVDGDDRPRVLAARVLSRLERRGVAVNARGFGCPVSLPARSPEAGGFNYGTPLLRLGMYWDDGVLVAGAMRDGSVAATVASDGTIDQKVGWWRAAGALRIVGRRLDGAASPLRSHVPDGYGEQGFQATGLAFPTTGCWRVTGTSGSGALSYVVWVSTIRR